MYALVRATRIRSEGLHVAAEGYDNKLRAEIRAGREAAAEAMLAAKASRSTPGVDRDAMPYRVTLPDGYATPRSALVTSWRIGVRGHRS
jgi:hypothetical protein